MFAARLIRIKLIGHNLLFSFRFVSGKNRLYPTYSVSSSETDDSPVHNNNKNSKGLQYLPPSSSHQYTLPYKPIHQQQQQLSAGTGGSNTASVAAIGLNQLNQLNQLTPSSDNASDATLTDAESTVLARKNNTSLIHNGKLKSLILNSHKCKIISLNRRWIAASAAISIALISMNRESWIVNRIRLECGVHFSNGIHCWKSQFKTNYNK